MKSTLTFSCLQYDIIWENPEANLKKIETHLGQKPTGELIILPEMYSTGFTNNTHEIAQSMNGSTVSWMLQLAQEKGSVILGSAIIKENAKLYNRMLVCFPDGTIKHYDKNYLYTPAGEHKVYTAGTERLVFEYKGWKICPLICYDLRFAAHAQNNEEIDLYIYSANWPVARIQHWKRLLAARAIENQAYTVGLNRIGTDGNNLTYNGQSRVYDYHGEVILDMYTSEGSFDCEISLVDLNEYRTKYPFLQDQQ